MTTNTEPKQDPGNSGLDVRVVPTTLPSSVVRRETDRRLPEPTERDGKTSQLPIREVELTNDEPDPSTFFGYSIQPDMIWEKNQSCLAVLRPLELANGVPHNQHPEAAITVLPRTAFSRFHCCKPGGGCLASKKRKNLQKPCASVSPGLLANWWPVTDFLKLA
jgi:hypothetical protein